MTTIRLSDYDPFGRDDHHGDPSQPDGPPMDADTCPRCDGFGMEYGIEADVCGACGGSGVTQ